MAFSFLDMLPDTQAGVEASKGARDIYEAKNKGAMSGLDLENALLKSAMMQQQYDDQQANAPLKKTMEAVQFLQGLNMAGGIPAGEIDLNNPMALQAVANEAAQSGKLQTNAQMDLAKAEAQATVATDRARLIQRETNSRNDNDNAAKKTLEMEADATAALKDLIGDQKAGRLKMPKTDSQKKALLRQFQGFKATYPNSYAAKRFFNVYQDVLTEMGETAPGMAAAPAKKVAAPAATKKPKTIVIDGRTFQKINGTIQEVK